MAQVVDDMKIVKQTLMRSQSNYQVYKLTSLSHMVYFCYVPGIARK